MWPWRWLPAEPMSDWVLAAARALDLDFIPLTRERYDLVIPSAYLEDEKIRLLLATIRSDEFKEKALAMGGYEVHEDGERGRSSRSVESMRWWRGICTCIGVVCRA